MPRVSARCGPGKWSSGKAKGADRNNIWFLLEFGHRFKASEWIPGAFVSYPKTNTKAFPNIFYKLCNCNSPIKNPMSPGQVGCSLSSSEIPGLPSLSSLILPSSSSGQPFVPGVEHPGGSGTAAFPGAHICSGAGLACPAVCPRHSWPWLPTTHLDCGITPGICEALARVGVVGVLVTGSTIPFCVAFPLLQVSVLLM